MNAFYPECRVCESGYALDKDGNCLNLRDPESPDDQDGEEEEESNASCNMTVIKNNNTNVKNINIGF